MTQIETINPTVFSALFNQALDAVVGMDGSGSVVAWNPSAEKLFGWSAQEAIGQKMGPLIVPPEHRKAHDVGLETYKRTGEGPVLNKKLTISALRRSGDSFPVELTITPVRTDEGELFFAFIRSLEEQHALAREREMRRRMAETMAAISDAQMQVESASDFIDFCLRKICEATGWTLGHFYAMDASNSPPLLVPTDNWYVSDPKFNSAIEVTRDYSFARGVGFPGKVWEQDDLVVISLADDQDFRRREAFGKLGLDRGFGIPIRGREGLAGVMEFFTTSQTRDQAELHLFARTIAGHIAVALQRKADAATQEVLRRELAHRASNSFAILQSVFRRCYHTTDTQEELYKTFEPRLISVSRAHNNLIVNTRRDVTLRCILRDELNLLPDSDRVTLEGPEIAVPAKAILAITVVAHELVTNTLKYGTWLDQGRLEVRWSVGAPADPRSDGQHVTLVWRETPTKLTEIADQAGYGTTLIKAMICQTLGGEYERTIEGDAFVFRASFVL